MPSDAGHPRRDASQSDLFIHALKPENDGAKPVRAAGNGGPRDIHPGVVRARAQAAEVTVDVNERRVAESVRTTPVGYELVANLEGGTDGVQQRFASHVLVRMDFPQVQFPDDGYLDVPRLLHRRSSSLLSAHESSPSRRYLPREHVERPADVPHGAALDFVPTLQSVVAILSTPGYPTICAAISQHLTPRQGEPLAADAVEEVKPYQEAQKSWRG